MSAETTIEDLPLPQKIREAGITLHHAFRPGDLGELIRIHGLQNLEDYGFNEVHEAYCARIASDFIIDSPGSRSKVWLAKKNGAVVGSVFIRELPDNVAQLRLLFVDSSVRGLGLGRWLVEAPVHYCREAGFASVMLWTVRGLDRAATVYESLGFVVTQEKETHEWGRTSVEVRYDLVLQ